MKTIVLRTTLAALLDSELADLTQRDAAAMLAARGIRLVGRGIR